MKKNKSVFIDESKITIQAIKDLEITQKSTDYILFENKRREIADNLNIPAYIVLNDKVLLEISKILPFSKSQFLNISGFSQAMWDNYGDAFLHLSYTILEKNSGKKTKEATKINKTSLDTFVLINDNKSISEIRGIAITTVISHCDNLKNTDYISDEKYNILVDTIKVKFPEKSKTLFEKLSKDYDLNELSKDLYLYKILFK